MTLDKDGEHYLRRVLRRRTGEQFVALDGESRAWVCSLGDGKLGHYRHDYDAVPPLTPGITLGLALCKGSRFEDTLEKLAELGVERVVPLETDHTERKAPSDGKFARWTQIAKSASAVATRLVPLKVSRPRTLKSFLEESAGSIYFCHPGGARAAKIFASCESHLTLLVGPEGGFSDEEVETLSEVGEKVHLGPLNLRVGTAAVVACALVLNSAKECG